MLPEKNTENDIKIIEPIPGVHNGAAIAGVCANIAKLPTILLSPGTKKPADKTGKDHREHAIYSAQELLDKTANYYHQYGVQPGIGLVTGEGIGVLDIDPGGEEYLTKLAKKYPEVARWRDETLRVSTGRGGEHLYFTYPPEIRVPSRAGVLAENVDVRAQGGIVVTPYNKHSSGANYEFDTDSTANTAAASGDVGAHPVYIDLRDLGTDGNQQIQLYALSLPAELLELIREQDAVEPKPVDNFTHDEHPKPSPEGLQRRVNGLIQSVREAKRGSGNTMLNWAAGVAAALGADRVENESLLIKAFLERPTDESREARKREAQATIESGWKWGLNDSDEALKSSEREHPKIVSLNKSKVTKNDLKERSAPTVPATQDEGRVHERGEPLAAGTTRATDGRGEQIQTVFADIAAIISGDLQAAEPGGGPVLTDGSQRFYRGASNVLIGDPETAKTLFTLAAGAEVLQRGDFFIFIDTDHNGPQLIIGNLLRLGVTRQALIERMKYAQPDDREELVAVVEEALKLVETVGKDTEVMAVLDSVGENLGLYGVSPNDDQGVVEVNRATAAQLARAGCTAISIDHQAKNAESRSFGATGSTAKKRAADGAVYKVRVVKGREFSPSTGGVSELLLIKDRRGGVRALGVKTDDVAARFELDAPDPKTGLQAWRFFPGASRPTAEQVETLKLMGDVQLLEQLVPPPKSKRDVTGRMKWGDDRALNALREWRKENPEEHKNVS